jgi:hypothetical protein
MSSDWDSGGSGGTNVFTATDTKITPTINPLLNDAAGAEIAYYFPYSTNKVAGNDTGLVINMTDIASPGTSLIIDAQVAGASKFNVNNTGGVNCGSISSAGITVNSANITMTNGDINFTTGTHNIYMQGGNCQLVVGGGSTFRSISLASAADLTNTSGTNSFARIFPLYNQASGNAANTDFLINRTETQIGSGAQLLIDLQVVTRGSYFAVSNYGSLIVPTTITTPGTTGDQTINKLAGRVNIAAAGTTITVTNSLVTANSIIVAVAATNDTTASVKNVVAAAGSFVINVIGVTAETAFNWIVIS